MTQSLRSFYMKRILVLLLFSVPVLSHGQSEAELVNFLSAGKDDASKLMNAYLNPVVEGLSYGFNGGWFHTAKAHKSLGFDLGVSVNAVFIPSSKNYFDPANLGLQNTSLVDPTSGKAPTIIGPSDATTYETSLDIDGDGVPDQTLSIDGPQGVDFKENFKVSGVSLQQHNLG